MRTARAFRAITRGERGTGHSVYVVLLHDPRRTPAWGLYVGQTARDPDWRFDQHKADYRSSSVVRRFGVRLLPELFEHLNPMAGWEALEIEEALANAFRDAGVPWVEGGHRSGRACLPSCGGWRSRCTGLVSMELTELVTEVLGRAPEWARTELSARDPAVRRRAEETMAAMIAGRLREHEQRADQDRAPAF